MDSVSQTVSNVSTSAPTQTQQQTGETEKSHFYGQTIGNPKLSDKAAKYYEQLKKKYSNMNFVLVSEDQKENAKANAASYANANHMVVLIDEAKVERMAEDESFRKQYEGIIANAASGLSQMKSSLAATGANVKGFGMQIQDDGTASFFAVLKKSGAAQKERIQKKTAENKKAKKAAEKKAAKKAEEKNAEEKKAKKAQENRSEGLTSREDEETVTITAGSLEELLRKVQDQQQFFLSDRTWTAAEKKIGQNVDYSV